MAASVNSKGLIELRSGKVELLPYRGRTFIEREFLTDAELIENAGKVLFLDVELYPNYYLCSFKLHGTNKFLSLELSEDKSFNSKMLSWILLNYRTVGFNSINYDMPIVSLSQYQQDTHILKNLSDDIILYGMRKKDYHIKYNFFSVKSNHIDLIELAPLKGSLKLYGARLHSPRIQDLPIPDTKYLTADEIEVVKQYNYNDLDVTEQLFDFMKERLELRMAMSAEYHDSLMSKSDAQIAEAVLAKEVGKLNGKRPQRPTIDAGTSYRYSIPNYIHYQSPNLNTMLGQIRTAKFVVNAYGKIELPEALTGSIQIGKGVYRLGIGGLHSSEKNVGYKATSDVAIIDRDVASYYPRIITTLGLYPQSMGPAFLKAYNKIIDVRLDAKRRKIFATDKGLKIVINGTSGKFSDVWSTMYAPDLTIQVTVTGQLALLMLIEILELSGIEVISANTDGIVMLVGKDMEDALKRCVHYWEQATSFETEETRYHSYYARDVNNYFAVKLDGSVKTKGAYSEVGSQSGTQLDTNPVVLICSDAVKALLAKDIPIETTIRECKDFTRFVVVRNVKGGAHKDREYLGKVVRFAYCRGEYGEIRYVTNNNKVADSDGAVPFMDMPTEWPDINYQWYIDKTTEILYDIGHLVKPKQLSLI